MRPPCASKTQTNDSLPSVSFRFPLCGRGPRDASNPGHLPAQITSSPGRRGRTKAKEERTPMCPVFSFHTPQKALFCLCSTSFLNDAAPDLYFKAPRQGFKGREFILCFWLWPSAFLRPRLFWQTDNMVTDLCAWHWTELGFFFLFLFLFHYCY